MNTEDADLVLSLASKIVAAYLTSNAVGPEQLPQLVRDVRRSLATAAQASTTEAEPLVPAVNPKRSVTHDHIVCLEDGRKMKTLLRHLKTAHDMTADEYRQRWGLPANYPMTAPAYTEQRSNIARSFGLGRLRASLDIAESPTGEPAADTSPEPDAGASTDERPSAGTGPDDADPPVKGAATTAVAAPAKRERKGPARRRPSAKRPPARRRR